MKPGDYINIIMGSGEWKLYHRKEFTKMLVSEGEEITYVSLPVSLTVNLFVKFRKRLIPFLLGKFRVNKETGFHVYTPMMLFHYLFWRKFKIIGKLDGWILSCQINRFLKKYYPDQKVRLWVYMPELLYLVNKVNYDVLVYDSYDDYDLNFDGSVNEQRTKMNAELIKSSDLVIVVSKYSYDKYSKLNEKIIRSRNGYTPGLFEIVNNKDKKSEYDKPVLGYVGTFRDWIDYSIIERLIESKLFTLMFIGYIGRTSKVFFRSIKENENVIHIDHVDISEIPYYMKYFSAGLIPFKINNFMKSVYPNKFFEYVSAGIPVVTTALPELEPFKDYIGYSMSMDEFLDNCKNVVEGKYQDIVKSYNKLLINNDWRTIVREILKELEKF